LQQYRLLPYLAGAIVQNIFTRWLHEEFFQLIEKEKDGVSQEFLQSNNEIHSISSGCKPVCTWFTRDALQTCRECLGGHGFSSYSNLMNLRISNDPSLSYEGENNVLIQQLERYLFSAIQKKFNNKNVKSPYGTINYLNNFQEILEEKANINNGKDLLKGGYLHALRWRVCYLLNSSAQKLIKLSGTTDKSTSVWNNTQVFFLQEAAKAHMELLFIEKAIDVIKKDLKDPQTLALLWKSIDIYALFCITKNLSPFLEGNYFSTDHCHIIKEELLDIIKEYSIDSISIIDAVALNDKVQVSAFGKSDGNIYKNFWRDIRAAKGVTERPSYWKLLRTPINNKPKL